MYNFKVATVAGVSNAALFTVVNMQMNGWSVQQGIESGETWLMAFIAAISIFALLGAKDSYHN